MEKEAEKEDKGWGKRVIGFLMAFLFVGLCAGYIEYNKAKAEEKTATVQTDSVAPAVILDLKTVTVYKVKDAQIVTDTIVTCRLTNVKVEYQPQIEKVFVTVDEQPTLIYETIGVVDGNKLVAIKPESQERIVFELIGLINDDGSKTSVLLVYDAETFLIFSDSPDNCVTIEDLQ